MSSKTVPRKSRVPDASVLNPFTLAKRKRETEITTTKPGTPENIKDAECDSTSVGAKIPALFLQPYALQSQPRTLIDEDGAVVRYEPGFISKDEAHTLLQRLLEVVPFEEKPIRIMGKLCQQHRLMCFYGDPGTDYTYTGTTMMPKTWPEKVQRLLQLVNERFQANFNSCLLNLYRTGDDYIGFHADDERMLGYNGAVVALSLGAKRTFVMKRNLDNHRVSVELEHGSMLCMLGTTQKFWKHGVPACTKKICGPRVSLTFRRVTPNPLSLKTDV